MSGLKAVQGRNKEVPEMAIILSSRTFYSAYAKLSLCEAGVLPLGDDNHNINMVK